MTPFWIGLVLVACSHSAIGPLVALWAARHWGSRWRVEGLAPRAVDAATYRSAGLERTWVSRLPRPLVRHAAVTLSAASTLAWPAMLVSDRAWRWLICIDGREEDALFALVAFAVTLALGVTGVFALRLIARVEDADGHARLACHVAWATAALFVGVASLTGLWLLCVSASLAVAAASLGRAMSVAEEAERELLAHGAGSSSVARAADGAELLGRPWT